MRKALVGLILAATVMTPVAAQAQRGRDGDGPRVQQQNESDDGEARAARAEQRQQRREARQAQQQPQVQVQQPQVQDVQRDRRGNRGDGDGNRNWRGGDNNNDNRGDGRRGRERANQPSVYPQAWQGDPNDPRLRHYQDLERRNQEQGARDGRRGDDRRDWRNDRRDWRTDNHNDRRDWRDGRRDRRSNWDRSWRNDRRYDWQRWRYSNRNIFHIGPYYSPYRGYGYSRFSIGLFLEPLFFSRNYWIGNPWQYRLPPAYPGTQWVRYYNDVLLVDTYSGEVLDVIHNFFY